MKSSLIQVLSVAAAVVLPSAAQAIYLNDQNTSLSLGPGMAAEPFANRSTAASLASVIDATSATVSEQHNQATHVWVSGGTLSLVFDFRQEYDLTALHFWNYHSEGFDVDNINFSFYDASNQLVGSLLNVVPSLGGSAPNDSTLIFAQDYALSFPAKVQYVSAVLSGSNGQVDFNNMGFSGTVTAVPEPTTALLLLAGLGAVYVRSRHKPG